METEIHADNVLSQIGAFLYATGTVHDDEDIISLKLGVEKDGMVPLTFKTRKHKESRLVLKPL